jgi:preprotein translocase subunit SecE
VARETRRQRRDQRKNTNGKPDSAEAKAAPPQRAPARQPQTSPSMTATSTVSGRREPRQRFRFIKECWGELQKVEWPSRAQVIQGTVVVIIACVIVGTYLYAADQIFKPFVRNVLLGQ